MSQDQYQSSLSRFLPVKKRLIKAHYAVLELRNDCGYAFGPCWWNTLSNSSYGYIQLLENIDEEIGRAMKLL